jgi:N-acyl-D-aspartate/D-glutamate deacylase
MTGGSAKALKLRDRGLLKVGYCADLAIFDPHDFRDQATYADPHRYPSGARTTVIVNGIVVVENANHTGATRQGWCCAAAPMVRSARSEWTRSDIRLKRNHARSS